MIKVNLNADLLKVLRRIPFKIEEKPVGIEFENDKPYLIVDIYVNDSAMQGMKE